MTFILGKKNQQNFCIHFLANLSNDLDEIQHVVMTYWFLEAYNYGLTDSVQGREILCDFMKYWLASSFVRTAMSQFVSNFI